MAAVSSAVQSRPPGAPLSGYSFEALVGKGWVSPELAKDPHISKYRRAFESSAFKDVVDGVIELDPICSIDRLKGIIYAQWTLQYLKTGEFSKDKPLFEDELWPRCCCPLLVKRLFPEEGEPGLNREAFLNSKIDTQGAIVVRLNVLCQVIARDYDDNQPHSFLNALDESQEAEWVSHVLTYVTSGNMEPEAIVKILSEAGVIQKKQY